MALVDLTSRRREQRLQQMMMLRQMLAQSPSPSWGESELDQALREEVPEGPLLPPPERIEPEEEYVEPSAAEVPEGEFAVSRAPSRAPSKPVRASTVKPPSQQPGQKLGKGGYSPAGFVAGLTKRGFSPEEAAAVAGNVHVESGFSPEIKSKAPGENSYGFMQWNGPRLRGLQNYAASIGKDWRDPEAQMDWIALERNGGSVKYGGTNEKGMYHKAFAPGGSPGEMAVRVGQFVERPQDISASARLRAGVADQLFRRG